MSREARGESLDPHAVQIVHTVQRCVRRAFLCGQDPHTGQSFDHRKQWIQQRLEFLASVFAIDCLTFAVMSNHVHLVLRSRPDVVRTWSDETVARCWLRLFPKRRRPDGLPARPTEAELNTILLDPRRLAELRLRLSDVSWWMRCLSEKIARRANREDQCTGRFWQGRFKSQLLLDEASVLACSMYVDLNPIRAAMAESLEEPQHTGAYQRVVDLKEATSMNRTGKTTRKTHRWERSRGRQHSGWLSPLEINEQRDLTGSDLCSAGRRASRKGFLSMPLIRYLELLDWTGRQIRTNKRGMIPQHLRPILEALGIEARNWTRLVRGFGRLFKRAVGNTESLSREAARRRQHYLHAPGSKMLSAG